ncbi:MAG: EcsC family protein [Oligoflexales bacterium]|nr:EcsC family protein [Oligoflexales bacterium]
MTEIMEATIIENEFSQTITEYELKQKEKIQSWKKKDPAVAFFSANFLFLPFGRLIMAFLPLKAIQKSLELANNLAIQITDKEDILRAANVHDVSELKTKSLELSDKLAENAHRWSITLAGVEGGTTGALGFMGIAADIPAIVTLALRTIQRIGICYGYESKTEEDKLFVLSILALSGANEMSEKICAITALNTFRSILARQISEESVKKGAESALSKEVAFLTVQNLAKQLGINITKRKALQLIPVVGAAIGASTNGWFIREVGWAARRTYQELWLTNNRKI